LGENSQVDASSIVYFSSIDIPVSFDEEIMKNDTKMGLFRVKMRL